METQLNTLWFPCDPTTGSSFGIRDTGLGEEGESCANSDLFFTWYMMIPKEEAVWKKKISYDPWGKAALKVQPELECAMTAY